MVQGYPTAWVWLALLGYVPFAFACVTFLGSRRGLVIAMIAGWLFLPHFDPFGKLVPLLHTKAMWVAAVLLLASVTMDLGRWQRFRLAWLDLPFAVIAGLFFVSSMANGHGPYEAASALFEAALVWGVPYLLGRVYLGDPKGLADLASGWVLGGLAYLPLIAWEVRMSPQLHRRLYGYHQHEFQQHMRFGGWRPLLFMQHGLMVGLFMACAALLAWWLWRTKARRRILGLPAGGVAAALILGSVACKSVGALVLLAAGILALEMGRRLHAPVVLALLLVVPPAYCASRVVGWDGESLVRLANETLNPERANSLWVRLYNERVLVTKALQKPWAGWSRSETQILNEEGERITVTDSLWIILLGSIGVTGLLAMFLALAGPVAALLQAFPGRAWGARRFAPAAALATVVSVALLDDLLNDMRMPMFLVAAGGITTLALHAARARSRRRARQRRRRAIAASPPAVAGAAGALWPSPPAGVLALAPARRPGAPASS
jgi:hypothetical protein